MDGEHLLHRLGRTIGIELRFGDSNTCSVIFDRDEVVFERDGRRIFLMAALGPVAGRDGLCRRLLEANYLGAQTGLACIGIDAGREEFVLHRVVAGNMAYPEFEEAVTLFVKAVRHIKQCLLAPEAAHPGGHEEGQCEHIAFQMGALRI